MRPVVGVGRRLAEAARLGFTTAVVPVGALDGSAAPGRMEVLEVPDLATAIREASARSTASGG